MNYRNAFDALDIGTPRRKYAPRHWLTEVYFAGTSVGWRLVRMLTRSPLTLLWRGIRDGWEMGK